MTHAPYHTLLPPLTLYQTFNSQITEIILHPDRSLSFDWLFDIDHSVHLQWRHHRAILDPYALAQTTGTTRNNTHAACVYVCDNQQTALAQLSCAACTFVFNLWHWHGRYRLWRILDCIVLEITDCFCKLMSNFGLDFYFIFVFDCFDFWTSWLQKDQWHTPKM